MKNKKSEIICISFIIAVILIGTSIGAVIGGNKTSENKPENNDNTDNNQTESKCLDDYLNASLKKVTTTIDGKKVNMKVLSCMTEQEKDNNKVKFYSKEDDKFYFEVSILADQQATYTESLDKQYVNTQPVEHYNIAVTDEHTAESGNSYSIVNVYKKDENDNINYKDYNMIGNLDDENIVRLRLVTTDYNIEDGFTHIIEDSLEIK